jgi:protein-tyrosine-phosphatase
MTRVLFVCLGNICRSPMAHGIFAHEVRRRGLQERFAVDSAGTAAYHAGEDPDPRTQAVLRRHGIALRHASRKVRDDDFERFDLILAMDRANHRDLLARCPAAHRPKVRMMLEPLGGGEVGDPYYGGPEGFDVNFRELTEASRAWLDELVDG